MDSPSNPTSEANSRMVHPRSSLDDIGITSESSITMTDEIPETDSFIYNPSFALSETSMGSYKTDRTINSRKSRYNAPPRRKHTDIASGPGAPQLEGLGVSLDVDTPETGSRQRPNGLAPRPDAFPLQATVPNPQTIRPGVLNDSETTHIRWQLCAEMKPRVATLVEFMYNFNTSQAYASISHNARRAQELLRDMNFIYPEPRSGRDLYRHSIIQRVINSTWFRNKDDVGVLVHEQFSPMPISVIALTLTMIECCIHEWSNGTRRYFSWDDQKFQTVYDSHIASLLNFQAHSPVGNGGALYQLQCDLSRNAREHAGVSPDPVTGSSRFPQGVLDALREEDNQPSPTAPPNYNDVPRVTVDRV